VRLAVSEQDKRVSFHLPPSAANAAP
jgi:hypothetical protein